uniref:testis-expressed protein 30 isoform X2 n=1 Tax=Doryrhamphus excisus TaxID=161450 RepID=UPI0025AE09CF|nr:testis-expressed protein 30 isoform X2 [Doryrhamphus excisus]
MDKFCEDGVKVPFGTKFLDAALCVPTSSWEHHVTTGVILTHGAGLNLAHRVKAYRAVWHYLKSLQSLKHIFFGGRSMGCRAAAALAKQLRDESESAVQGVICLSFPLHPPGQTHAHHQRSEDLRGLPESTSVLFVSGTEDTMCDRVLFEGAVKEMKAQVEVFWLNGGSHGLKVSGRSEDSVLQEVNSHVISWLSKWEA